jgi:hypothetical protein
MAEFPIKFQLTLEDQLSVATNSVKSSLNGLGEGFNAVKTETNNMASAFSEAKGQVNEVNASYGYLNQSAEKTTQSTQKMGVSMMDNVSKANTLALAGANLYLNFDRIEKAQLAVDKSQLNLSRSTRAAELAQQGYNDAVAKYGPSSEQAKDASDKLKIAQDALTFSQERAVMVSDDLKETMVSSALTVIPSLIGIIQVAGGATKVWSGIQAALNAVMSANPIAIVVLAIAGLVAAVVAAYTLFPPFKDAVDAVGKALGEGLGKAVELIKGGLEWLWINILKPLGEFLVGSFMTAVSVIGDKLAWLAGVLKPIGDAFGWLAGVVGGAINAVGNAIEEYNAMMKAAEESTKNGLSVMENYYNNKFSEMTRTVNENLNKQLEEINIKYADMTTAENESYKKDMENFTSYWSKKLGDNKTKLDEITGQINEFYDKQISAIRSSTEKQVAEEQAGYDRKLSDFSAFWNQKLGIHNNDLDQVQSTITSHYNDEVSAVQASYQTQIDETNLFYDNLQAATDAGLMALRESRQTDLDNMELLMLEEKVSLQQAYDAGLISEEVYQKQKSELSKSYNDERSKVSDEYRLQELQAEKTSKEASVTIATERETALTTIKTKEATDISAIEVKKNADLTAAATQYNQITQTDFQALTAAITALKQKESSDVTALEKQKNADLKASALEYYSVVSENANNLVKIETDKANEIERAEKAAAQAKKDALATIEASINRDMSISAEEKKRIIANMNASCLADTQTQWTNIASTIQTAMDKINSQNVVFQQALNSGRITAEEYAAAMELQNQDANNLAALAEWNAQNAVFTQAYNTGAVINGVFRKLTKAEYDSAMAYQNANKPTGLAKGGIVTQPTFTLTGEAGTEAVIPLEELPELLYPVLRDLTVNLQKTGDGELTQHLTINPVINIGNISNEVDLDKVPQKVSEGIAEYYRRRAY